MALVSNAAAASAREEEARRLMPPPRAVPRPAAVAPKPPVVLDEDTYTSQLEAIIERDYFPELPKMANQLEWLKAVNSGDVREMQKAQRNISRRRAATLAVGGATPGPGLAGATPKGRPLQTPGTGWTQMPGTGLLRTPAMTPAVGQAAAGEAAQPGPSGAPPAAPPAPGQALSLDAFLAAYTSEDNASFQAILAEDNRRKRAKVRACTAPGLTRPQPHRLGPPPPAAQAVRRCGPAFALSACPE
jgi:protein DGCR14